MTTGGKNFERTGIREDQKEDDEPGVEQIEKESEKGRRRKTVTEKSTILERIPLE